MNNETMNPDAGGIFMAREWGSASSDESLIAGIMDDDCAIWRSTGSVNVVSQDFINVRPALVDLKIGNSYDLGRLSVKATISDLAATGAEPVFLLCGCRIPKSYTQKEFQLLAKGIADEAQCYGAKLIGGDTKQGTEFTLMITGYGISNDQRELMVMKNAQPGDDIWVSGPLGSFSAAVFAYKKKSSDKEWKHWADTAIRGKTVPLALARSLAKRKISCGATDVSDGFTRDLRTLCSAAGVGAVINLDQIPVEEEVATIAEAAGLKPWQFALVSGGDFQFIASARPDHSEILEELSFYRVGKIVQDQIFTFLDNGKPIEIDPECGHADSRGQSFADEITHSLQE